MRRMQGPVLKAFPCASALFCAAAILLTCTASKGGEIRVGTAAVKITPPLGTPMAGYYGARGCQGVLDDLYAKAAVLDDGKTKVAMVVCDLLEIPLAVIAQTRKLATGATGIPGDNIMISVTHTHTGPAIVGVSLLDDLVTGGSKLSQEYTDALPAKIAQAVSQASAHLMPARLSFGHQVEPDMSFIRRFWLKDGSVGWNPGQRNPNIIRPIGTIDPEVNVLYAESRDAKSTPDGAPPAATGGRTPLLTYVNFPMHTDTTGGMLISADYPATLARRLADYKGPEMMTLFANGSCGNINHLDVRSGVPQTNPQEAKRLGTILSAAVLKAYMRLTDIDGGTLRVRREMVPLPLAPFTDEELRTARAIVAKKGEGYPFLEQVKAYRIADVAARQGKPIQADIQVFALGRDIAWVALPGETFVELGMNIKAASPFRQTNIVGLANGTCNNYIPNCSAYAEGQYEPVSARCAAGSGELLVTAAIRSLNQLHEDAANETAAAK